MGRLISWEDVGAATVRPPVVLLEAGVKAPLFCLPDADMGLFDLADAIQRRLVVLHFYPRDAMPSSRRQAIDFSEHDRDFARCGALVVGISLDECMTHANFRDENGISIELLSDPDGEVCRLYQVWQERLADGVVRPVVRRASFIVGRDGTLLHADYDVDPHNHTRQLLERLRLLGGDHDAALASVDGAAY